MGFVRGKTVLATALVISGGLLLSASGAHVCHGVVISRGGMFGVGRGTSVNGA